MKIQDVHMEVGPGWHQLAQDLHEDLLGIDPTYRVQQIKEKFGGLRYYYQSTPGLAPDKILEMDRLTRATEKVALRTCETCGTNDGVTTAELGPENNWIQTLCPSCREQRYANWLESHALLRQIGIHLQGGPRDKAS